MSSPLVPKALLKGMNARARRSLGQHFLKAPWVLDHILAAASPTPEDVVLEIGPGLGVLTERLVATGATVVALEKDARMVEHLRSSLARWQNLRIVEGDALEIELADLPAGPVTRVAANLPYNVATPILFRLVEARPRIHDIVVMVQKEVADRIVADPGSRAYGALTVRLQMKVEASRVVDVPPSAFHPPPKVDSTVLRLVPREAPPDDPGNPRVFHRVVAAAFGSRRKTLRNALLTAGWPRPEVDRALADAGIDPGIRGERLGIPEFCALSRALSAAQEPPGPMPSEESDD